MTTNCRIFSMLAGLALSLLAGSVSTACTTPGLLPGAPHWAPSANIAVAVVSPLTNSVVVAANNWNQTFAAAGACFNPSLILSSSLGGPAITFSYDIVGGTPCPAVGSGSCIRGQTDFTTDTTSLGFLETITIEINKAVTTPAAMTEVAAHEIGHTMGLKDCSGCALHSSVMVSNVTLPAGSTWNTLIGTPGPTGCDIAEVFVGSPGYLCPPPPPPPHCHKILTCGEGEAWSNIDCQCEAATPIIIDISGKGFDLTSAAGGVQFDISGTGHQRQMGWTASGASNAFLALPAADGLVHNGKQLFGNFTPQPSSDHPNGFAALAVYDEPASGGNGDGVIDSQDAIFSSLRLWIDENHDGICQPEELHTLPSLGVDSISLAYHPSRHKDEFGNLFRYRSRVNPDDPDISHVGRIAYDVFLVTTSTSAANALTKPGVTTKNFSLTTRGDGPKCAVPAKAGMLSAGF